ncbi:hypothetical protein KA005_41390 [bacterium]|nr:hypothetical protein [bacterium]
MEENLTLGRCGHCGGDKFRIYNKDGECNRMIIECDYCKNTSVLRISKPDLIIDWHEESKGIISFNYYSKT